MNSKLILVINCGSSSLKFALYTTQLSLLAEGLAESLNSSKAELKIENCSNQTKETFATKDHKSAINKIITELQRHFDLDNNLIGIGHRIVHGGDKFKQSALIDRHVEAEIKNCIPLAPLHNPANLLGINILHEQYPNLSQVAVFDTSFHQTMPTHAFTYAIPYRFYEQESVRRYGFHGTSHYFVANQVAQLINKPIESCNLISAHLGNGCSVTVIKNGKSVDTSLGMTPLEGVMMGTRSGDIDAGIIFYLVEQLNYTIEQVNDLLNKGSGLLGVSGISNDCRTLECAMLEHGDKQAELALNIFCYRIAKAIASFSASLVSLDGLIFTGGIGENSSYVRANILAHLTLLNFAIDQEKNLQLKGGKSGSISKLHSRSCWVIPTNEEWVIAKQSHQLLVEQNINPINQIQ